MSFGAFPRCARYRLIRRLDYSRMVFGCSGGDALLYDSSGSIKSWYSLGSFRIIRDMAVDKVLALVAAGRVTEIDCGALKVQK